MHNEKQQHRLDLAPRAAIVDLDGLQRKPPKPSARSTSSTLNGLGFKAGALKRIRKGVLAIMF